MALNAEKCDVAFFTTNYHEAQRQPTIVGSSAHTSPNSADKFNHSCARQAAKLWLARPKHFNESGYQLPNSCFAHFERVGLEKGQFMKVYEAIQPGFPTNAGLACQTWITSFRIEQLEQCQHTILRVVTG